MNRFRGLIVVAAAGCVGLSIHSRESSASVAAQNPDQDAVRSIVDGSREVVRTSSTQTNRYETDHLILYIDKDLLTSDAEQAFAHTSERIFLATSKYLQRSSKQGAAKPALYLTNRAGISHAEATRLFLNARRVIPSPAIVIHETVHLLLIRNPDSPRNRSDTTPEEDMRLMAHTGMWLPEGFAGYVSYELAPTLGMAPDQLFVKGDRTTVDEEARQWMRDPRGAKVLPFVGAHGVPDGQFADRANVAAPFYVLSQSFIKYLVQHAGLAAISRLYEEHFDGTRSIEDDVTRVTRKDLSRWRTEWLASLSR